MQLDWPILSVLVWLPIAALGLVSIAALGVPWIVRRPEVLRAIDPRWAIEFIQV